MNSGPCCESFKLPSTLFVTRQTIKQAADKELSERTIERQTKTQSFQSNFQQSTCFSAIYIFFFINSQYVPPAFRIYETFQTFPSAVVTVDDVHSRKSRPPIAVQYLYLSFAKPSMHWNSIHMTHKKWFLFHLHDRWYRAKLRSYQQNTSECLWGDIFQFQKITDTFLLMSLRTVSRKRET